MNLSKRYPFKFLEAYSEEDKDFFFGREEEVSELYEMVFKSDVILVYGASGTGKTSLIQCGLSGKFKSYEWLPIYIRRGRGINESLLELLTLHSGKKERVHPDTDDILDDIFSNFGKKEKKNSVLEDKLHKVYLRYFKPIYLIFDQLEELYILGSVAEQQIFISSIKEILAASQPVKIIFSIREEYLGYLYEFEKSLPSLMQRKLRVEPMNLNKVTQVIEGIGTNKDSLVKIAHDNVNEISKALFEKIKGSDRTIHIQLPYLQVLLDKIYLRLTRDESRQSVVEFKPEDIDNIAEIDDMLRDFLEERIGIISRLLKEMGHVLDPEQLWKILSLFVTLEGTKEPISFSQVKENFTETGALILEEIISQFVNHRILKFTEISGLFEIAHDSLALAIADKRTDEEIARLEIKRLIKSHTALRADAIEFFTERQLNFIEPYYRQLALSEVEVELIEKSKKYQIYQNRKRKKRFATGFAAVVIVLFFMTGLALYAIQNKNTAESERGAAEKAKAEAENALNDFLKQKSEKETLEFTNLESRALIVTQVGGCPSEIIKEMKAIAKQHPDSIRMTIKVLGLVSFCKDQP